MDHRATAVASRAIERALRGEAFQVSDVQRGLSNPPSRQTCYRVLSQLEADGWLQCSGKVWYPGLKPRVLGDVNERDENGRGFSLSADELLEE